MTPERRKAIWAIYGELFHKPYCLTNCLIIDAYNDMPQSRFKMNHVVIRLALMQT